MGAQSSMGRQFRGPVAPAGSKHNVAGTYWHPGGFDVTAGHLDETARQAFSSGQCHALAKAVHERTGWPIAVRTGYDHELEQPHSVEHSWDHAYVVHPSGKVLDVHGLRSRDELDTAIGGSDEVGRAVHKEVPYDWEHFQGHGLRKPAMKVARSMVDPLLKQAGQ